MLIQNSLKSKRLMQLGMLSFILFALLGTRFLHAQELLGEDLFDGARGMFMGLSVGFNLMSVVKRKRE